MFLCILILTIQPFLLFLFEKLVAGRKCSRRIVIPIYHFLVINNHLVRVATISVVRSLRFSMIIIPFLIYMKKQIFTSFRKHPILQSVIYLWWQGIPEALMKAGAVYKYDLSLPVEKMYDLVEEMRTRLSE